MATRSPAGLLRLWNATRYSWAGIKATWRNEEAFRQESLLCLCLIPVALWLGQTGLERALLISSLLLIMIVELLNSGIEAVPESLGLARATLRTIKQNLFWAFFYNVVGVPLAALGFLNPVLCAAAMGLSDLVVLGNALRLGRWRSG